MNMKIIKVADDEEKKKIARAILEALPEWFGIVVSIPWWRSHPIHENRATESIWTEPCNPLLRATKSTKRATSNHEMTLFYII